MPSDLANAIANAEGYGQPGAIPTMANNPGDLEIGDQGYGLLGQGITHFATADDGWAALENQLALIANGQSRNFNPNMSLSQIGQIWAGSSAWANNVASYLGVSPATPFSQVYSPSLVTAALGSVGLSSLAPTSTVGYLAWGIGGIVLLSLLID